ncbi:MAG: hypothetical protein KC425_26815 [Anaerolineales bacterium]|nr:hypothetical protein [Anaerolineales bacterium]
MEAEVDLRPYIEALVRAWKWIAGVALATAVAGLILGFVLPPTYEVTALVAVTEPNQLLQFEAGFEAVADVVPRPLRAYPELAVSDSLLAAVREEVAPQLAEVPTQVSFDNMLTAESGSDLSLIRLRVRYRDAAEAALIVNTWAALFVAQANDIYGGQNSLQLVNFESQLTAVSAELEAAEDALIAFQARNERQLVENELLARQQTQADYLAQRAAALFLLENTEALRAQLAARGDSLVTLADQLTALLLQVRAFNVMGESDVQLQIGGDAGNLTTASRPEQLAILDGMAATLTARLAAIDETIAALRPEILALQAQREQFATEESRLARTRDRVQETYLVLARKVEETRIASEEVASSVRLASEASVPERPVAPSKRVLTLAGGVLGLLGSVSWLLLRRWWRFFKEAPA